MRAALLAAALALAAPAAAQDGAEPSEPAASDDLSRTYGDWTLRCADRPNAAPCDIFQAILDQSSGALLAAVSIAYSPPLSANAVQIIVPLGVHLPSGLTMTVGEFTAAGVRFTRCELQGCYLEARLGDGAIEAMRVSSKLDLAVVAEPEQTVTFEISLDGFSGAYDALIEETAARTPPPR